MRHDHELTIPELVAKIEELIGYVRIKSYGEGFEEGRKFEQEALERKDESA